MTSQYPKAHPDETGTYRLNASTLFLSVGDKKFSIFGQQVDKTSRLVIDAAPDVVNR